MIGMVSPPWDVLAARHARMSTVFWMNRTLPSHMAACTPPVWKLRAVLSRARVVVEVRVHRGRFGKSTCGQMPPVWTSLPWIGLFGGAEVLQLMMTRGSIARHQTDDRIAGVMQGVRDTIDHKWLTLRASLIGVGVGIIPGLGGAVSQFIAYAHAQQTSKHPETFGKGNVEGVLAAGAVKIGRSHV